MRGRRPHDAGLHLRHSVLPPEDWHHQLRLGIQMGIGAIAYSVIMLTVFRQRVLHIYCIILGQNRAPELLADPLTERCILSIPSSSPQDYPKRNPYFRG